MIRFNILEIALFVSVVLHPCTKGQVLPVVPGTPFSPRPLCNYQMALANQACAYLPFIQIPPPAPRTPFDPPPSDDDEVDSPEPEHMRHTHAHEHGHRHEHHEDPDPDPHHANDDHGHDHDHDHDHGHDHGDEHDHKHGHAPTHHHRRRHRNTPVEEQCCKWLAQVDDQCVCELLVHLPPFLARPIHNYAVIIGKACSFTFSCGSGLRK